MATEAFELPTEEEELAELRTKVGMELSLGALRNDANIDAFASDALRIMRREEDEISRYEQAMNVEIQRVQIRYGFLIEKHAARRAQAEEMVKECARQATFPGKSRSRHVGNGTYGIRQKPDKYSIVDDKAFITWCHMGAPTIIRTETKEKVLLQDAKPILMNIVRDKAALPPGVTFEPAHDEPYAKVEGD